MRTTAVIELHRNALKFSAGHLMMLSDRVRESLHGHDYQLNVALHTIVGAHGLALDLRHYRDKLLALCATLDYHFILPGQSPWLKLEEQSAHWIVHFNQQHFSFLKTDAVVLPICNVTLEELSGWFLAQLTVAPAALAEQGILGIQVKVFNGRDESASVRWGQWQGHAC